MEIKFKQEETARVAKIIIDMENVDYTIEEMATVIMNAALLSKKWNEKVDLVKSKNSYAFEQLKGVELLEGWEKIGEIYYNGRSIYYEN